MDMHEYLQEFLDDARGSVEGVRQGIAKLQANAADMEAINDVMRHFHTLKGTSGMMQFTPLSEFCLELEMQYRTLQKEGKPASAALLQRSLQAVDGIGKALTVLGSGGPCPEHIA